MHIAIGGMQMKIISVRRIVILSAFAFSLGCSKPSTMTWASAASTATGACHTALTRTMAAYSVADACENSNNYVCGSHIITSDITPGASVAQECTAVSGLGTVCLSVDTTLVKAAIAQTDYHCSNSEVRGANGFVFQSSANTLSEALATVVDKCRTGSL